MERLTAEDLLMLWPDEVWPQDIGVLAVLAGGSLIDPDGRLRIEAVRQAMDSRLHLVPRFRQLLHVPPRGLGGPLWVDAPAFDLADHVRVVPLPAPGDEAQLLLATEQLRRRRLDRSRPLWEMWLLPGLPDGGIGLFVRMHHAIADGVAAVATVGAFLDLDSDAPASSAPPWTPTPMPTARELFAENLRRHVDQLGHMRTTLARSVTAVRHTLAGWPAMRELFAQQPTPATSLNHIVGPGRRIALIRSNVNLVKDIAHAYDAKVNDVLLAITAGGLRGLMQSRGEAVEDLIVPIYVPVTLRPAQLRAQAQGNLIGQMIVPLPLGGSDPSRRLRQIAAETATRKAKRPPPLGTVLRSRLARRALLKVLDRQPVNVTTADLPGPRQPVYLTEARLLEVFPVLPLIANVSLGVGALSYAGQFNITAVADQDAYPDLDVFTASAQNELRTLAEADDRRRVPRPTCLYPPAVVR
jgi:diacylglycerol O-acyltransferase